MLKQSFVSALLLLAVPPASAEDWPQFRGPTGQGVSTETELPVEWSESRNVRWKVAVPGAGWSSPVVAGDRVWLTTAVGRSERDLAAGAGLRRRPPAAEVVDAEVFRLPRRDLLNPKNTPRVPYADRRGRPRLRPFRRGRNRGAHHQRRDRVEDAVPLRVAARQRRLARPLRRPADLQLRRQRHGVRRRARQADRQGAVEDARDARRGTRRTRRRSSFASAIAINW